MLSVYDFVDLSRRGTRTSVCSVTCHKKVLITAHIINKLLHGWFACPIFIHLLG